MIPNYSSWSLQTGEPKSKTKGTHVWEILKFEKNFKVKWNPQVIRRVVRNANEVFQQKRVANEDRCWQAFKKAKARNPLVQHKSFMKPFKFPSLTNTAFGIVDPFSDPARGTLEVFYLNPLVPEISLTGLQWSSSIDHVTDGYMKITRYPPLGNSLVYFLAIDNCALMVDFYFDSRYFCHHF